MKFLKPLVLYTALAVSATAATWAIWTKDAAPVDAERPARLATTDMSAALALRRGTLLKLALHATPQLGSDATFTDPTGGEHRLEDYAGKYVLLNFWATWCTPCRKEMPSLDRLQRRLGGANFEVVPVATAHNPGPAIERFWREAEIANLPVLLDPDRDLAADFGALSLPVTILLDPEGREIGRLTGDAEWDSDSAIAILMLLSGARDIGAEE